MTNRTGFALYLFFMCSWLLHLGERIPILGMIRADLVVVCIIPSRGCLGGRSPTSAPGITFLNGAP